MSNFSFLSGSTIDCSMNLLFDAIESGSSYIGLSRGTFENVWGVYSLIYVEPTSGSTYPTNVVAVSGNNNPYLFFDKNSLLLQPSTLFDDTYRNVVIKKYIDNSSTGDLVASDLKLVYMSNNFALIEGLNKNYYQSMPVSSNIEYYLETNTTQFIKKVKINNKTFLNIPFYSTNCELWYKEDGNTSYTKLVENIQKISNMIGETYIVGMVDPNSLANNNIINDTNSSTATTNKNRLLSSSTKFILKDINGNIIQDELTFVNPNENSSSQIYTEVLSFGNSQKYLTLKFTAADNKQQLIKLIIGTKKIDEIGIWTESLSYDSVVPVSDSNPPGLDVSYLRNPNIASSIFDVNGLVKITSNDVKYVKEILTSSDETYYKTLFGNDSVETITLSGDDTTHNGIVRNIINDGDTRLYLQNFHTFVVGDTIQIKNDPNNLNSSTTTYTINNVSYEYANCYIELSSTINIDNPIAIGTLLTSSPTNIYVKVKYVTTVDKEKALKYNFTNIMITKNIPVTGSFSPTENVYRQLFISYKPKKADGTFITEDIVNGDNQIIQPTFNPITWKYDIGILLYLANKLPVYRKWANVDNEQFKIIL